MNHIMPMAGLVPKQPCTTCETVNKGCTVINFAGAPGAGKSTLAADLFVEMKRRGHNVELVTEYAKDCVWKGRHETLKDQVYMLGKQHNRLFHMRDKVDFVITDSPLFLLIYYGDTMGPTYTKFVIELYRSYNNINFYIRRTKPYNPIGRNQTESESDEIAIRILNIMNTHQIPHIDIDSDTDVRAIVRMINL